MIIENLFPPQKKPIVIAEIGVNHEGSVNEALKMIKSAALSGADFVKFQSYTPERFVSANDSVRLERAKNFSLTLNDIMLLANYAKEVGVGFLSTPISEDWVNKLNPFCSAFKIASGDISFKKVIQKAASTGKPLLISTGAATLDDIDRAVEWVIEVIGQEELPRKLILLHCVCAYPAPISEANILSIPFLRERYCVEVGYSNHVIGSAACIAAVALGASVIEVHFTSDKTKEFRDHHLSFDENDLKKFIATSKEIVLSLGVFDKKVMPSEVPNVALVKKGIIAGRDIKAGEILTEGCLLYARPATEFHANEIEFLIGKRIKHNVIKGYLIKRDSIECVE